MAMVLQIWKTSMLRLPWGLVCGLLVAIGVEQFVKSNEHLLIGPWYAVAKRMGRAARMEAPKCGILCFGDSQVKLGALPQVIEKQLGRTSCNLATAGGQPPGTYFMLRRALKAGAHPAGIVVDFNPTCISHTPRLNTRVWAEVLTLSECLDLAITERDASYFGLLVLNKLVPSLKVREEIRSLARLALKGKPWSLPLETAAYLRNANRNKGAVVESDCANFPWPAQDMIDEQFCQPRWYMHLTNALYMRRVIKLAAAHGIPVLWLLPPVRPQLQAMRDQRGYDDQYLRAVSGFFVKSRNVFLVDGRHSGFPERAFQDMTHLSRTGALSYSANIASVIKSLLDGETLPPSRIVQLPAFQDFTLDPLPEDLNTSRVALQGTPAVMRK
jgi:hypothetical protein